NHLTNINLSNRKINYAHFSYNELNTFIAENLISISINISNNLLATLNVNNANTVHFDCSHNQFQTLDFSKFTTNSIYSRIYNLNDNPNLKVILMKNGTFNYFENYNNLPQLKYICSDEDEISYLQSELQNNGITSANVGSYCNFTPGGNYNTITGTVRFDENNNGCDTNDEVFEFLKLKINDGTNSGETFVKNDGSYNFYTQSGDFTVTAEPENPSLYTVTPSSFSTNFVDNNNNISTQNICVTKNGHVKDLEVVFAPVTDARPGFDAVYKVIWRNKGNTTLSGSVTVNFNNSKLNFLSSSLPSTVSGNQVTFNFTNLKPYQNTASEITFNVNPPTHATNPVNIGDILNFSANITPLSGDVNQDDNQFVYKQTVVGSYDPNDITCLEGNTIPLAMVGKHLHYIVNFENTGTAPATNIVVEMEINPDDFDISSLQLQNTSHNSYTKITGNKVEFMMKDINLAASAHGNIALKIKSKNNLVSGDSVNNKANIYFDYNFPVETNDAVTNIEGSTLAVTESNKGKTSVNVYPNPTKGDVNIAADSKINSIEIYDAQGRIIQKQTGINSQNTKVSIHSNTSGMYILKIITEKETLTKKIIKN
ncbi:MAG: T9SS type A sorting domain-containing protein, partial [Chryseobacterium sp.]